MSAQREWHAHGLKIWETGSDGLERVIADFNQDKYKACRLAAAAPALLEALEAWMAFENSVTQAQEREFRDKAINKSKDALAKAR